MSDHQRQVIREAAIGQLSGRTSAGDRVQATRVRVYSPKRAELPAIAVYTLAENSDADSARTPRQLERALTIDIAGSVDCSAALDDPAKPLDALALEIEAAMDADPFLGGAVGGKFGAILESTEVSFPDLTATPLVGIVTLTYSAIYYTSPAAPGNLDELLRVGSTTRIAGATDDNTVHDVVDVRSHP